MRKIAIVGSRRRQDRQAVENLVLQLRMRWGELEIISGGCKGPDTWAEEAARVGGIKCQVIRPAILNSWDAPAWAVTRAMYERNRQIAAACDELYAFPADDRRGGTENAIAHAKALGKRVTVVQTAPRGMFVIEPLSVEETENANAYERERDIDAYAPQLGDY